MLGMNLPVTPPEGVGVIYPSCDDRSSRIVLPIRAGTAFGKTGEANLCLVCGPGGAVYHPGSATWDELVERWPDLAMLEDPTDVWMHERYGNPPLET